MRREHISLDFRKTFCSTVTTGHTLNPSCASHASCPLGLAEAPVVAIVPGHGN